MSSFPEESFVQWTRELQTRVMDKIIAQGQQVSTWLVVGNAAALVIAFSGTIQGSTCDARIILDAVRLFAWGLGLAFTASVVSLLGGFANLRFLAGINTIAEAMYVNRYHLRDLRPGEDGQQFEAAYDAAGERLKSARHPLLFVAPALAVALSIGSVISFGAGLTLPMRQPAERLASCSEAAAPTLAPNAPRS